MAKKNGAANARAIVTMKVGERDVRLKLTLGALADIEDEFDIETIDDLPNSGKALCFVIQRFAKAAGDEVTIEELREADIDIRTVVDSIKAMTGGQEEQAPGNAPTPSP